ncbi:MAG: aconitate hydratase [Rhizomicrobium sp.]
MPLNLTQKIIQAHLRGGDMQPGKEIAIAVDQTLTQDATGTLVMLTLEALGLERVHTEISVQYVDHNLLQLDSKNAEDHLFLHSACERFGLWLSPAGNGVSHPVHMQCFGKPGKTLAGSDSHTPAAGSLGMLAIGSGGLDVAMAMAGEPLTIKMPKIWGIKLVGKLKPWVSAKDVILELLRRHDVDGGVGRLIEYYGPGLDGLSAMDRHVIANMGAELGATSTVFPSDEMTRTFLESEGRGDDWMELRSDPGCLYDIEEELDLSRVEPLVARPASPGNVVRVRDIAGEPITQAYIGSSANPGYRDFAIAAAMAKGRHVDPRVSFDINPTSRRILGALVADGHLSALIDSGARIHQCGCNGCIGMGQAPATNRNSLRTVPRNFPGRSGTREDRVFLCSPETATASALKGAITDPRDLGLPYPPIALPAGRHNENGKVDFVRPLAPAQAKRVHLVKGANIVSLPKLEAMPESLRVAVLLKLSDNISTDEILPAGARVLPYRSNIPKIAEFCFDGFDPPYSTEAGKLREKGGHAIVAGRNYGQGSSREHAALAPRFLGLRLVIAKSFARIHWQNLVNYGVLPLTFADSTDYDRIAKGAVVELVEITQRLCKGSAVTAACGDREISLAHELSQRQVEVVLAGGLVNWARNRRSNR